MIHVAVRKDSDYPNDTLESLQTPTGDDTQFRYNFETKYRRDKFEDPEQDTNAMRSSKRDLIYGHRDSSALDENVSNVSTYSSTPSLGRSSVRNQE